MSKCISEAEYDVLRAAIAYDDALLTYYHAVKDMADDTHDENVGNYSISIDMIEAGLLEVVAVRRTYVDPLCTPAGRKALEDYDRE